MDTLQQINTMMPTRSIPSLAGGQLSVNVPAYGATMSPPLVRGASPLSVSSAPQSAFPSATVPMRDLASYPRGIDSLSSSSLSSALPAENNFLVENKTMDSLYGGSIEKELGDMGYTVQRKIFIGPEENKKVRYILVNDNQGYDILLDMDKEDGYATQGNNDIFVDSVQQQDMIDYSIKAGVMKEVEKEVNQVAFVCKDGVCVVERKNSELYETDLTYVSASKMHNHEGYEAFPVLRLTDVRRNCQEANVAAQCAAEKLLNHKLKCGVLVLEHIASDAKELNALACATGKAAVECINTIVCLIQKLKFIKCEFEKLCSELRYCPENKRKFAEILCKLKFYYGKLAKLATILSCLNGAHERVELAKKEVCEVKSMIERECSC
ncbi:Hypothetical protein ORPV_1008 [Orpheovirus IHUMI-LCC2]|uniref:Uncharacterized protein n=1 Tax=Orpheovirus IHUMI-LCC2 TaxID=2023057 RepID=A0A2I2L5T7_9VIRU|nr:Hypothetical protein ORPV_1008 [Orpheovirus IHUMI-LCC2]SNW62912.1 Hypothetical protein ORPV_1008 [Orpheovirus IHUMI-LCC2]